MTAAHDAIFRIARAWERALVRADVARLEEILADDYVETDEAGQVHGKSDILAALASGDLTFTSLEMSDERVRSYGTSAVATGIATQDGRFWRQALPRRVAFTDVYVLQNGLWRAAAAAHVALVREQTRET